MSKTPQEHYEAAAKEWTQDGWQMNWRGQVSDSGISEREDGAVVIRWKRLVELWFRGPANFLVLLVYEVESSNELTQFTRFVEDRELPDLDKVVLTPEQVKFFEVEIRNEEEGGVFPATLESALESLGQAPGDVIADWCDREDWKQAMNIMEPAKFSGRVLELVDRLGGEVLLQDLLDNAVL